MADDPPVSLTRMAVDWLAHRPARDPYLVWAGISEFSGYHLPKSPAQWIAQLVVETANVQPPWQGGSGASTAPQLICKTERQGGIWTGNVDATTLQTLLAATVDPPLAIELDIPRISRPNVHDLLLLNASVPANMLGSIARSVVAVIDHGCPFAHRQFRKRTAHPAGQPWHTRVTALWDQDPDHTIDRQVSVPVDGAGAVGTWLPVGPFGYGRELTVTQMDGLIAACTHQMAVDEDRVYQLADYEAMYVRRTHGAHVLDLAAGDVNPMTQETDAASDADIIFVQLPRAMVADTSGGSMTKYVLDALAYILAKTAVGVDHLVINLSYGATAGAHDGASLLERGMDLAIEQARAQRPGRHIELVVAAGNHILAQGHARMAFDATHSQATMDWQLMPDDRTDNYLELWYDNSAAPQVTVTLRDPSGRIAGRSTHNTVRRLEDGDGALVGAMVHTVRSTYGPDKGVVLIALRPTHVDSRLTTPLGTDQAPAMHGQWSVDVQCLCAQTVLLDAWVQRDDPLPWQGGQPQSELRSNRLARDDNDDDVPTDRVMRRTTSSSLATGRNTMVAGAYVALGGALSRYTAAGPTYNAAREGVRTWPDCIAVADTSAGLPGLLASGTRSGVLVRMNGTSVAAPQVARALINWWNTGTPPPIPVAPSGAPAKFHDLRDFRMGGYRL
jgi:hypothetical protein